MNVLILLRKNNFLLFFVIFSALLNAQSKRFYYELNFKRDTIGEKLTQDIVVLEINKDSNIFLSNDYIVTDSINNAHNRRDFAYPKFKTVVEYSKLDDNFDFIHNLSMYYYEFKSKRKIDWKLVNEKKEIGIFSVSKAVGEYGGRHWTAWFCQDIPFPFGPYVFYGLPGLILEVYDDNENFHFSFIQNKNYKTELNSDKIIKNLFDDRKIDIKEKDWKKIQLNFYNNPIPEYKEGKAVITKDSGEDYTQDDYRNLERTIQKQIKTYNNPIELNEKIDYK